MLFNLDFTNNTILSCFFFFFFIIYLWFLIPADVAQISNSIPELVITIRIPSKETKEDIGIHAVNAETKIRKWSI